VTLDVFLESETGFDREAAEAAFARNGVPADSTVTTADGGEASVTIDDDGAVVVIESLTPELAQILFDVARSARLAILPADGTPNALVPGDATATVPEGLDIVDVESADALYESLRRSEELRGARSA
jgi:hypothetical protein